MRVNTVTISVVWRVFLVTELAWDCGLICLIRSEVIFYLMGMLKGEVYNNKPYIEDDKKTII